MILLTVASLFFYAWWDPKYLFLLIPLIVLNYKLGKKITRLTDEKLALRKFLLISGLTVNLGTLLYFKYFGFFTEIARSLDAYSGPKLEIILPLGISFFTFQKIAYLVDCYQRKINLEDQSILNFSFFVSFFPQLIAGPIVHFQEITKELKFGNAFKLQREDLARGLSFFAVGLFKKAFIADSIARFATPIFNSADAGQSPTFIEAWTAALSYSAQIFFDFSGYSDMAIGLALLFGIQFPINFSAPYQSQNITEFWRRWHMTLSRFLRDYLYIPLGGNQKGEFRRYLNLMITMLLGGLWHGAGWNFLIWGALHGSYLVVNHLTRNLRGGKALLPPTVGIAITYFFVVLAWIFFRATTLDGAVRMAKGYLGLNGLSLPTSLSGHVPFLSDLGIKFAGVSGLGWKELCFWLGITHLWMFCLPPSHEVLNGKGFWYSWKPEKKWAFITAVLLLVGILYSAQPSEFLYFQF